MKKILSLFLALVILLSSVTVSLMFITSADASGNAIVNGGFENGLDDWTAYKAYDYYEMPAEVVTTEHNSGEKSLNYHNRTSASQGSRCLGQVVTLEPNSKYKLTFYLKGKPGWGSVALLDDLESNPWEFPGKVFRQQWSGDNFTTWTKHSYSFYTTEKTEYKFIIALTGTGTEAFLDDFVLELADPKPKDIIANGGFENGLDDWTAYKEYGYYEMPVEVVTTEKNSGEKSLNYHNMTSSSMGSRCLGQEIQLEPNTKYTLSFYMKGKPGWGSIAVIDDVQNPYPWQFPGEVFKQLLSGCEFTTWTKHTYTFFSTDKTDYKFIIALTGTETEAFLDDIKIERAEPKTNEIISNGSFENDLEDWTAYKLYPYYEMPAEIVTTEKNTGEKSLNYYNRTSASIYNRALGQQIKLEANTKYTLSFYLKGKPQWGKIVISGDLTGKIWEANDEFFKHQWQGDEYNTWTKHTFTFFTDDRTDFIFAIALTGANTEAYFDDIKIEKARGVDELVVNGGFEQDLEGWTSYKLYPYYEMPSEVVTTEKKNGEKSLNYYNRTSASIYNRALGQQIELEANTKYRLTFYIKGKPQWGSIVVSDILEKPWEMNGIVLRQQWQGDEYEDWTKQSFTFTTNDKTDYLLAIVLTGANTEAFLDDFSITKHVQSGMVINGDFSDGDTGWDMKDAFKINDDKEVEVSKGYHKTLSQQIAFSGGNLFANFDGWLNQKITVEKGRIYEVSVDAFLPEDATDGCDLEFVVANSVDDIIAGKGTVITLSEYKYGVNAWQSLIGEYSADNSIFKENETTASVYIGLRSKSKNGKLRIDNVKVGSLVSNSDFEATVQKSVVWSLNKDALSVDKVTRGQNYELSFRYKGKNFETNNAMFTLSDKNNFDPLNTYIRGYVTKDAADWTDYSVVFNSGSKQKLELVFQTLSNEYCLDNVDIIPTESAVTIEPFKRAYFVEEMSGSYYAKYKQPASGKNLIANEDFVGTSSGNYNDALNFVATANGGTAAGKIVSNGSETGASYLGNSSLKFEAGIEDETVSIPLSLKKNTKYMVGIYLKTGQYVADNTSWSRFSYGIGDTSSGNFIRVENLNDSRQPNLKFTDVIQCTPRFDQEWHYLGFTFTTNDQDDLSFMLRGRRMTAYIDKLYVWEATSENTADFLTTLDKVGPVKNIKAEKELLDVSAEGTNLIENSDFESGTKFWEQEYRRVGVYGNNLSIIDSGDYVQQNSFLYENQLIYPWNCYYIKWVDVKPNTDYTFSAKYVITDVGDGFFGIAPGYKNDASVNESTENMLFPSNGKSARPAESRDDMFIGYWDFTEENYNENQEWKSVGVTFNSGDRNRVGFFVQDGGGTAYIDDVRLFETKYAVKETVKEVEFPSNLEAKNDDISVENGFVKGVEADKTLSALAKSFKNSKYVRFFDLNGEEITDLSTKASTGIEARLMNGPVIKDRANIVVNGDVNGDGVLDSTDADAIVKHITLDESLEWAYLEAADFDGDGEITVNDALFNKEASKSGSAKFVLTGPERIGVGKDIEVSLVADTNNAFAVSGKILFNNKMLTLKSVKTDLGKAWNISSVQLGGEVDFAAVNSAKGSGTVKDKAVITFTFTVGNVKTLEDVKVSLENGLAATSDKLLKLDNCSWPIIETEKDNTSNDNSSTDNDSNDVIIDNNNSSDDKSEETTEITTIVKAANRLSVLKLDEAEISPEFDPEVREYTATVPYEVEKVTVTAIAENEDATVTIGDTNLEYIGKNAVTITVVSADGLKRAYRIIVTREAPTASGKTDKDAGFPLWAIILIIVGAALLVAAVVFLLIIMKRRKKTA